MLSSNISKFSSVFLMLILSLNMLGQTDSTYIGSFDQDFSAKMYAVEKLTAFAKENTKDESKEFTYRTNNPVNLGVGVSWKNLTISFGYGFDFFRNKNRGKTNSLEFQHHWYGRKFIYDFFLQQHSGFYNSKPDKNKQYILYPDIKMNMYGGTLQYVFNNKKFSYKAALNQNEKQLKSAGSVLVGMSLYYSKIRTDKTILFDGMSQNHENLQFGVAIGYAHTWVINRYWFLTGSASGVFNMGNNRPYDFLKERMEVYPGLNGRIAFGYNSHSWSLGGSVLFNRVYLFLDKDENLSMNNTNFQFSFIKRFHWGNKFVNETLNKTKNKLRM